MLDKLVADLRFVIGLFFGIISIILLIVGLTRSPEQTADLNLNLLVGVAMAVFSAFMLTTSILAARSDKS